MWIVLGWDNITPRYPKGEGSYEDVGFPKYLGATAACIKRPTMA